MMKNVFLNAMRFAFTGTPVFKFERNTFIEFAHPPKEYHLDVYFIKDSIDDKFTLPIVYDVIQEGKPVTEGIKILLQDEDVKKYIEYWLETSTEGSPADDMETFLETGAPAETLPPQSLIITKSEIRQHLTKVRVFLTNEKSMHAWFGVCFLPLRVWDVCIVRLGLVVSRRGCFLAGFFLCLVVSALFIAATFFLSQIIKPVKYLAKFLVWGLLKFSLTLGRKSSTMLG